MTPKTDIPYDLLMKVQTGTMSYTYKDHEMLKNPFDMALYAKLIWEQKPATIIEIGSWQGGSAVWFADQMALTDQKPNVISVDIEQDFDIKDDRIRFMLGDAYDLGKTLTPELLQSLSRPLLVIEDADHSQKSTRAVMDFFASHMRTGEYFIIEDGILHDMKVAEDYGGGPTAAIDAFMADNPDMFTIDRTYCDFFGKNVTWNVDGFLRRL
ncbi:MAG: CmcI family methyltransferase [Pseudomonadota bacterium]